jgi:hypothetical protein
MNKPEPLGQTSAVPNIKPLPEWNDGELQVKVATLCGWETHTRNGRLVLDGLPNYPSDLNAMHEAEVQLMTANAWPTYLEHLADCSPMFTHRATARQRAEAFVATLTDVPSPKSTSNDSPEARRASAEGETRCGCTNQNTDYNCPIHSDSISRPVTRTSEGGPIKLNEQHKELIVEWAKGSESGYPTGDKMWGNEEARRINLETFARSVLKVSPSEGVLREALKKTREAMLRHAGWEKRFKWDGSELPMVRPADVAEAEELCQKALSSEGVTTATQRQKKE